MVRGVGRGSCTDITVWLSGLGLRKYVDKFVHEEIDVDTLPYLTEEHLEKLVRVILTIEHRRHIIKSSIYPYTLLIYMSISKSIYSYCACWFYFVLATMQLTHI